MSASQIAIIAAQFFLSLSLLIVLHELGHFIPAKLFKIKVEKFYLFFDPWFSLFKKKKGDTEYGIGWLPLGGYVKIAGMVDESMDKEQMALPPQPWEFRSKPAWQRLIVMIGGVVVNLILGFLIFAMMLFAWGEEILPPQNVTTGYHYDSLFHNIGIQDGDKIIAAAGKPIEDYRVIVKDIVLREAKTVTVDRNGSQQEVTIPEGFVRSLIQSGKKNFIEPRVPFIIGEVSGDGAAAKAGIKSGDRIIGINGQSGMFYKDTRAALMANKNKDIQLMVLRNADTLNLPAHLPETGMLGVQTGMVLDSLFKTVTKDYTFFQAIPAGVNRAWTTITDYAQNLKMIFTSKEVKVKESVGGFISIAKIFPSEWNWAMFWERTAWLSLVLAFMNILPIPALDGGHVMFLLYEMVTGRKPNEKVMEYAQVAGMVLLLGLILFVNGLDVFREFIKK
jgi:regulator of sigma E protease